MYWIKSGMEKPSKSEVIGRCGGDEKNEWSRRTYKSRTLKNKKIKNYLTFFWNRIHLNYIHVVHPYHHWVHANMNFLEDWLV